MKAHIKLFLHKGCPYAQRTWIVAAEKGLLANGEVELVEVSLPTPQWYNDTINPRAKVPALQLPDGHCIPESLHCALYLEETFAGQYPEIQPKSPKLRAAMRLFIQDSEAMIGGLYKTLFATAGGREKEYFNEEAFQSALKESQADLTFMEGFLAKTQDIALQEEKEENTQGENGPGPYVFGKVFTLADICLVPHLQRFSLAFQSWMGIDVLGNCPRLKTLFATAQERPAVRQTSLSEEEILALYNDYVARAAKERAAEEAK